MTAKSGVYGGRKILEGTVVSDKMENTVMVSVEERMRHRLYKKTVKRQRKFMAHDEELQPQIGDRVRIVEARPMSRRKRWLVIEVLQRIELPEVAPESIDLDLLGEVKPPVVEEPDAEATPVAAAVEAPAAEATDEAAEPEVTAADEPAAEVDEPEEVAAEPEPAAEEPEVEAVSEPEPESVADEPEPDAVANEPEAADDADAETAADETTDDTIESEATTEDEEKAE